MRITCSRSLASCLAYPSLFFKLPPKNYGFVFDLSSNFCSHNIFPLFLLLSCLVAWCLSLCSLLSVLSLKETTSLSFWLCKGNSPSVIQRSQKETVCLQFRAKAGYTCHSATPSLRKEKCLCLLVWFGLVVCPFSFVYWHFGFSCTFFKCAWSC